MKKLMYLIVLALILGLVLTGCLLSNVGQVPTSDQSGITYLTKGTETDPDKFPLYAGQDILVGIVNVWNNADYLYVKYELSQEAIGEGWCLTETHLAVVTQEEDFPTNKAGNPKVGHFPYQCSYNGSEWVFQIKEYGDEDAVCDAVGTDLLTEITYTIPFTWDPCTELYIAAHAVVQKLSEVMTVTLVSDTQTFSAGYTETEPGAPLDPNNYSGLGGWSAAVPVSSPPIPPWINPSVVLPGAVWVSSSATTEGGYGDQWRLFKEDFTIPSGAVNITGSLYMTADNAIEAYLLNGTSVVVGTTGYVYGAAPSSQGSNFATLWGPYTLTPLVGLNNLMFVVRNWVHSAYNPTGLIYKLDYEYQLLEEETAWAAGSDFLGKNWATYFTYTVVKECCDFNAVGDWAMNLYIGTALNERFIIIISHDVEGDINGLFGVGYDTTGAPTGTITGEIDGCSIDMHYENYDGIYTADFEGTIAADGNSMSGTWSDYARIDEPWTMTR